VERWNGGTQATIRLSAVQGKGFVFGSLVVVLARCRAFPRVVIPNEFQPDGARIGWERIKKTNSRERAKTRESFLGVDPR
jgi:hypothetical protein